MGEFGKQFGADLGLGIATTAAQGLFGIIGAKKANKRNLRNWKRQNRYNTPLKQRQRLEAAGINPHFGLTGGGQGGGTSGPLQATEKPETPSFKVPSIMDKMLLHANIAQSKTQTDLLARTIELLGERHDALGMENQMERERIPFYSEKAFNENALLRVQMSDKEAAGVVKWEQIDKMRREGQAILENLKLTGDIKKAELRLKKKMAYWAEHGIRPNDPPLLKVFREFLIKNPQLAAPIRTWVINIIRRITGIKTQ